MNHLNPMLSRQAFTQKKRLDPRAKSHSAWLAIAKQRRPADLPRLLASITATYHRATDALARLQALETWPPDPRAVTGVIANLENIPFHTSSTKPFWSALIAFAEVHGDPQTADLLDALSKRFGTILRAPYTDMTAIRTWFANQVKAAAAAIRTRFPEGPPVLDAEITRTCERIAKRITTYADPGDKLLAEIAARPDDDHARQVYADYLQERGDPRGELIVLQLSGRDPVREEELLATHIKKWLGPLAPIAHVTECAFERGFPAAIRLTDAGSPEHLRKLVGDPIWATVRRLELGPDAILPTDLLRHPVMRSLTSLGAFEPAPMIELASWDKVPYTSLALGGRWSAAEGRAFLAGERALAALRTLELDGIWMANANDARWLFDSKLGKQLEQLAVGVSREFPVASWFAAATKLAIRSFRLFYDRRWGGAVEFTRDAKRQFSIAHAQMGGGPLQKRAGHDQLSYGNLVAILDEIERGSLAQLRVTGRRPMPKERGELAKACERFPKLALDLPA